MSYSTGTISSATYTQPEQSVIPTVPSLSSLRLSFPYHPFHLTANSPWPLYIGASVLSLLTAIVFWFNGLGMLEMTVALGVVVAIFGKWFTDVLVESDYIGNHTNKVGQMHGMGVILFVVTEVFFFVSIFWAFFHSSLSPTTDLGISWPPAGIIPMDPFTLPLLNTFLLLSSGATTTAAHHGVLGRYRALAVFFSVVTDVLALAFLAVQIYEYSHAMFTIADGVYGAVFFFTTGFHCFHVIIGLSSLIVFHYQMITYNITSLRHNGFEGSILYWHFVDVVWLFVLIFLYIWGGIDISHGDGVIHMIGLTEFNLCLDMFSDIVQYLDSMDIIIATLGSIADYVVMFSTVITTIGTYIYHDNEGVFLAAPLIVAVVDNNTNQRIVFHSQTDASRSLGLTQSASSRLGIWAKNGKDYRHYTIYRITRDDILSTDVIVPRGDIRPEMGYGKRYTRPRTETLNPVYTGRR